MPLRGVWQFLTDEEEREKRKRELDQTVERLKNAPPALPSLHDIGQGLSSAGRFYTENIGRPGSELIAQGIDFQTGRNPLGSLQSSYELANRTLGGGNPLDVLREQKSRRPEWEQTAGDILFDPANLVGGSLLRGSARLAIPAINASLGATGGAYAGEEMTGTDTGTIIGSGIGLGIGAIGGGALGGKAAKAAAAKAGTPKAAAKAVQAVQTAATPPGPLTGGGDLLGLASMKDFVSGTRLGDRTAGIVGQRSTNITTDAQSYERVTKHVLPSQVARLKSEFKASIRPAFQFNSDGTIKNVTNSPTFGDLMEAPSLFSLSKAQQTALQKTHALLDQLDANDAFYGVTRDQLGFVDQSGRYFPRIAVGQDGIAKPVPPRLGGAGQFGSKSTSRNQRYYMTMEEGMKKGINYALPENAFELHARSVLRESADQWFTGKLMPYTNKTKDILDTQVHGASNLIGKSFDDPAIAKEIQRTVAPSESWDAKLRGAVQPVNNLLTPLRATLDVSAVGTLGVTSAYTNPKGFLRAAGESVQALWNKPMVEETARLAWQQKHGLPVLTRADKVRLGLVYAGEEAGGTEFNPAMITPVGRLSAKASGVFQKATAPFDRSFGRFRSVMAEENFDQSRLFAKWAGKDVNDEQLLRRLARDSNLLVGVASDDPTHLEKAAFFAAGYFRSNLELIGRMAGKNTVDTNILRTRMISMLTIGSLLTMKANELRNKETDTAPVRNFNGKWRYNPNFMKVRDVFGVDISLFGGWDSLLRMAAVLGTGAANRDIAEMLSAVRPKGSPSLSATWDLTTGRDFMGKPITDSASSFMRWAGTQFLPFSTAGATRDIAAGKPAETVGIGTLANVFGVKATPLSPLDNLDVEAKRQFNRSYYDLERWEQHQIQQQRPELWKSFIDNSKPETQAAEQTRITLRNEQMASDARLDAGEISYKEWRRDLNDRRNRQRAVMNYIYRDQLNRKDTPLLRYFDIINANQRPDGTVNWDAVDGAVSQLPEADRAYILRNTNVGGTAKEIAYNEKRRQAAPLLKEYYAMPRYRGVTAEEGEQVAQLIQEAQSYQQQFPQGRMPLERAIRVVGRERGLPPNIIHTARRAHQRRNVARQRFWRQHPILEEIYGDIGPFDPIA